MGPQRGCAIVRKRSGLRELRVLQRSVHLRSPPKVPSPPWLPARRPSMSSGQTSERLSARAKLLLLAAALSSCITRQGCVWQLAATVTHTWTATNMWTVTNLPRHYSVICVRVPSSNLHGITSYASHLIILPYPMTWFSTILPQSPGNPSLIPGSRKTAQWYSKALAAQRIQATVMKEATVMRTDSVRTMASPFR